MTVLTEGMSRRQAMEAVRDAADALGAENGKLGCHSERYDENTVLVGICQQGDKSFVMAVDWADYSGLKLAAAIGIDLTPPANTVDRAKRAAKALPSIPESDKPARRRTRAA